MNRLNDDDKNMNRVFKSMDRKLDISEQEKHDILSQMNNRINQQSQPSTLKKYKYYVSLTIAIILLFILILPTTLSFINNNGELNSSDNWEVTSTFTVKGEDYETVLRGVEGEAAFLDTMDLKAGQEGKTRWFFWGEELQQVNEENFILIGTHHETGEERILLDSNGWEILNLEHEDNSMRSQLGAQASQHAVYAIPSAGLWRLDAYIGEKLYGSVVIEVAE